MTAKILKKIKRPSMKHVHENKIYHHLDICYAKKTSNRTSKV